MTRRLALSSKTLTTSMIFALSFVAIACVPDGRRVSELDTSDPDVAEETSLLAAGFNDVADRWDIPRDVLKAIAFRETRFSAVAGEVEFDGQPASFGYLALRGAELDRAAAMLGRTIEEVRADPLLGVDAAGALLTAYAHDTGIRPEDRDNPLAWAAAIAKYGELADDFRAGYVRDVLGELHRGRVVKLEDGTTIVIRRNTLDGFDTSSLGLTGAGNAIWRPSPNYNSRNGSGVELVVIHSCEGNYGGCVGWLRNTQAQASAHYVVSEDGGEVSQLVDEAHRAWHVAASYRPHLNDGALAHRSGQSVNTFSVGIEHGGFARQASWSDGLIDTSVNLVRDITARHGIPRDRYHIVSHGRLQPESRTDPGPNWPWGSYIEAIQGGNNNPPPPPPEEQGQFFSTGDFNGDGKSDWSWHAPWTSDFIVMLSNGDGHWRDVHNSTAQWGDWSRLARHFSTGDFDGNGSTDWSWYAFWTNDFIVMLSNGDGTFREVHNDTTGWGNWADGRHFRTGDFDGNGRADWSWYAPWTNDFIVMLSNGDGTFSQAHNDTRHWGAWADGNYFSTGDFDGDGATDWSWFAPWTNDFIVMFSTRDGAFRETHATTAGWGEWSKEAKHFATGDYDGNGRTDWSWYAWWTDDFIVMLSNGDGTWSEVHNYTGGWGNWSDGRHFRTGDFDGNGTTDWSWYAYWTNDFIVMLSDGRGGWSAVHNNTSRFGNWGDGRHFRTGDFDGNASIDWSWYAPWTNDHLVYLSDGRGSFTDVHNDTTGWGKF